MPVDTNPAASLYDGAPLVLRDADGNPLPFPPTANGHAVLAIKDLRFPELRFEWHPGVEKVYVIDLNAAVPVGHMLASQADTHGKAQTAVWIFLRGLRWEREKGNNILAE